MQGAIEDRCWNFLLELPSDIANRLQQSVHVKSVDGRSENHGGVVEEEHLLLHPLSKHREVVGLSVNVLASLG